MTDSNEDTPSIESFLDPAIREAFAAQTQFNGGRIVTAWCATVETMDSDGTLYLHQIEPESIAGWRIHGMLQMHSANLAHRFNTGGDV